MALEALVRTETASRGWSMRKLALVAGVDVSTLSRSMKDGAFTSPVKTALLKALQLEAGAGEVSQMLQKALLLLQRSDMMRVKAEAIVQKALRQISRTA